MNLKELSESLGLSQTTVSRALNGHPEVREQTRLRVREAARAANYSTNARARRLATGRAMATGPVRPLSGREGLGNPLSAGCSAGSGGAHATHG